ncbi:unannotated protein [freshwater metagenome]|uniref:Unannotated protein n=1 Tax=freshwater metagenome TaxID=449393 RepID=A0A6J7KVP7_9ZZZZ
MQVQVRDVATKLAELSKANDSIGVCAVDVNLTAGRVDLGADVDDCFFVDSVRRRVGDHQSREAISVLCDLRFEVFEVDVAVFIAGDHDYLHAGKNRRGCVCSVSTRRNQANGALSVAARKVVATNRH